MKLANESLNAIKDGEGQLEWLRQFYRDRSARYIGSKQNVRTIVNIRAVKAFLLRHNVRVVRLRRKDLVRAAISQVRAELYAAKMQEETGKPTWGVRKGETPLGRTYIDPTTFAQRLKAMAGTDETLMAAFEQNEVLDIDYEQLNDDLDATVRAVREHICLPQVKYTLPFIKATPDDLSEAVENLDELRVQLRGTPFESQI